MTFKACIQLWLHALETADPSSCQRGLPIETGQQPSDRKYYLVTSPGMGSTPKHTDWPSVSNFGFDFVNTFFIFWSQ
jgi:hypothetical protein